VRYSHTRCCYQRGAEAFDRRYWLIRRWQPFPITKYRFVQFTFSTERDKQTREINRNRTEGETKGARRRKKKDKNK
jgi:hypothetical protein